MTEGSQCSAILGTNWKMNKSRSETREYARTMAAYLDSRSQSDRGPLLFVIPPLTSLHVMEQELKNYGVLLGVQNIHWADSGPYTGEISPMQAKDAGAEIALIGHSERRKLFRERDFEIKKKVNAASRTGLTVLLCVGEEEEDKQDFVAEEVVRKQVKRALVSLDEESFSRVWIAYEPVWAIGEGSAAADRSHVRRMHHAIQNALVELKGERVAERVSVLYGGSVTHENVADYLSIDGVDGVFVGRFALDPNSFIRLADAIACKFP